MEGRPELAVSAYLRRMSSLEGVFPFGLVSGRCAPREAAPAEALVLGVYPSALHVRWTPPPGHEGVRALAVAPEPWPFWDGNDQAERVAAWRDLVGWESDWGSADPAGRVNGSSGLAVRQRILEPLRLTFDDVWLTDALPFFHVHRGRGTQGAAMSERYDRFASARGLPLHDLPDRPTPTALVTRAIAEEAQRLRDELRESRATLVITLGNEALAVAAAVVSGILPASLSPLAGYGQCVEAIVDGRQIDVLPLVHPGQRGAIWAEAHNRWMERTPHG